MTTSVYEPTYSDVYEVLSFWSYMKKYTTTAYSTAVKPGIPVTKKTEVVPKKKHYDSEWHGNEVQNALKKWE